MFLRRPCSGKPLADMEKRGHWAVACVLPRLLCRTRSAHFSQSYPTPDAGTSELLLAHRIQIRWEKKNRFYLKSLITRKWEVCKSLDSIALVHMIDGVPVMLESRYIDACKSWQECFCSGLCDHPSIQSRFSFCGCYFLCALFHHLVIHADAVVLFVDSHDYYVLFFSEYA